MTRAGVHPALAVAVALLLGLAGCAAPPSGTAPESPATGEFPTTATPTAADGPATTAQQSTAEPTTGVPTATGTTDPGTATDGPPTVEVRNGTLPVDAGQVFADVRALLDVNASAPAYVQVVDDPADLAAGGSVTGAETPRFWRLLGLEAEQALDETELRGLENGVTTGLGGIRIYPGQEPTADRVRWLLAHEYVHYVAVTQGWGAPMASAVDVRTTDGAWVARAVGEGVPVVAIDAYLRQRGSDRTNSALYRELARTLPAGSPANYSNGAYVAGHRYVEGRLDDPARAPEVFADPPLTGEQVLHGYAPEEEPPASMPVAVNASGPWRHVGTDRLGEAFVRSALADGVDFDRAARAAAGWGTDSLRVFRTPDGDVGYAWLLRFDTDPDASEFAGTMAAQFDARGDRTADGWRVAGVDADVRTVDDRTVAVVLGDAGFVDAVAVASDGDGVGVSVAARGDAPTAVTGVNEKPLTGRR